MIDLTRSAEKIREKGGSKWAYVRVDVTGSLSGADTWHDGIIREKSKFTFEKPEKKVYDESGQQVATTYENVNSELVITSMQDDVKLEKFLTEETEDAYFSIIMAAGDEDSSHNKIRYIPIARISTVYSVDAPGRRPDIKISPQWNENLCQAVATASLPTWIADYSSSLSASAGMYYGKFSITGSVIL